MFQASLGTLQGFKAKIITLLRNFARPDYAFKEIVGKELDKLVRVLYKFSFQNGQHL